MNAKRGNTNLAFWRCWYIMTYLYPAAELARRYIAVMTKLFLGTGLHELLSYTSGGFGVDNIRS
ncbi:hypothetical protein PAXRUDRAFT_462213 [Paxillus rubicundulus Ve08.2h10]|uniref:Uncharacterized protein n=1 Tax=Paxillus rubicundulus Ve08.2h10 TaxID=930991 RepID=A0A0D0DP93_9AGAM|nr:hypothetical protein PAXRUDRAFT_462213 [Paxillus rubicundulus Ve08.2h10]